MFSRIISFDSSPFGSRNVSTFTSQSNQYKSLRGREEEEEAFSRSLSIKKFSQLFSSNDDTKDMSGEDEREEESYEDVKGKTLPTQFRMLFNL